MKTLLTILLTLLTASAIHAQSSITLDHTDGLNGAGIVGSGQPIVFHIRLTNNSGRAIDGSTNGFRVYSPDGALWNPIITDTTGTITASMYDQVFLSPFSITGSGADTIGVGGFRILSPGIPDRFNDIIATISTQVDSAYNGKTLCLDSSFYPPGGTWKWSMVVKPDISPTWDGPHCFAIQFATSVSGSDSPETIPTRFTLNQNYPNPFNPVTTIKFNLPVRSNYRLNITNTIGQVVATYSDNHPAGEAELTWDASGYSSGIYFYRLQVGDYSETRSMVLVK